MMLADKTADIQLKTREKSINTKRNYDSNARFKQTFELGIMFAPFVGRPVTVVLRLMRKPLLDNRIETPIANSHARRIIKDFSGPLGRCCFI